MKSIIRNNVKGVCYICGSIGPTEEHHIFFGNKHKKLSEKYGLKVYLCPYCHRDNKNGAHGSKEVADHLRRIGQTSFERDHTREEFRNVFKKNYLDDTEKSDSSDRQQEEPGIIWLNSQEN